MFVTSNPCWACNLQHPKPLGAGKVPSGCQGLVHSHTTIQVPIFLDMYIYIYIHELILDIYKIQHMTYKILFIIYYTLYVLYI